MSEPACECVAPGFCPRYKIGQGPYAHAMCRGDNCTPRRSEVFRLKLRLRLAGEPYTPPPPAPPGSFAAPAVVALRPACAYQGAEVPGCKTCGGPGSVLYYCESPDDDADRCVRGPSRDPSIRSCLDCPHHEARP